MLSATSAEPNIYRTETIFSQPNAQQAPPQPAAGNDSAHSMMSTASRTAKLPKLLQHLAKKRVISMNYSTTFTAELDQIEDLYEVCDEVLEAAAGNEALPAITMFCTGIGCPVLSSAPTGSHPRGRA